MGSLNGRHISVFRPLIISFLSLFLTTSAGSLPASILSHLTPTRSGPWEHPQSVQAFHAWSPAFMSWVQGLVIVTLSSPSTRVLLPPLGAR
ncbi:hypothetical protein D9611_005311 [Ephemerocybe angulata]|uniref:Secreted protein n=1 Tax=Ephemerocybe angulata TaxID=980116 RepID=A0A8H5C1P4_9AGAR|nr:hypothetical protein D9611_005311 [Tulosesus angulatus]